MILAAILCWSAASPRPLETADAGSPTVSVIRQDDDVDAKIRDAGKDVAALLELAASYKKGAKSAAAKRVFARVIELDTDNEIARKGLRHQRYDGRWFESYVKLQKYKRKEDARMKTKGLMRWEDGFVPEDDFPYLRAGLVQDKAKEWVHPTDLALALQIEEWKAAGYQFRPDDSSYVASEDLAKWSAQQWKCDDKWLELDAANAFHSDMSQPWELTGDHFVLLTTCEWSIGNVARWHADRTHDHLARLFGVVPKRAPVLYTFRNLEQYNVAGSEFLIDSEGVSSLHGGCFSDCGVDLTEDPVKFIGMGLSFWDASDTKVSGWGPYWLRWAAAQSYVDAIDPSPLAVTEWAFRKGEADPREHGPRFWSEKCIPRWLRYGAASYVERFLPNPEAAEGTDPWDLQTFAFSELKKSGGLRKLSAIFDFKLDISDPTSALLYNETGLLVSFLLDGAPDDAKLKSKHEAFRKALASGKKEEVRAAAKAIEAALLKREKAIRAYASL